jgi:hypothetical protein
MQDDPRDTVRSLAALAGVPMSEERVAALAMVFRQFEPAMRRLSALDYGDAEPAARFRPPAAPAPAKRR